MKRLIDLALCALLCATLFAACARAEIRTYVYGGSEDDVLENIAVSADGRILMTGYANSSDGTLSDRTMTGRSGWALCVDAQGEVLFSFLTRHSSHDAMYMPVFHEDRSCTALLQVDEAGVMELELIRLDAQGEIVFRKTLAESGGDVEFVLPMAATDEGYVLIEMDGKNNAIACPLYGYDGEYRCDADPEGFTGVAARGERHVVRSEKGYGTGIGMPTDDAPEAFLYAADGVNLQAKLCKAMASQKDKNGNLRWTAVAKALVSLPDGGCVLSGYASDPKDDFVERKGWIARFDAEGNRLFDWQIPGASEIEAVLPAEGGYAALAWGKDYGDTLSLLFFDEGGVKRGETALGEFEWACGAKLAALPDGALAALADKAQTAEDRMPRDAVLIVIPKEDIPR